MSGDTAMRRWPPANFPRIVCLVITICAFIIGIALFARGIMDYRLIMSGDEEGISICSQNPELDCNPHSWKERIWIGLLVSGLSGGGAVICYLAKRRNSENS
jgi:hypothetical protein